MDRAGGGRPLPGMLVVGRAGVGSSRRPGSGWAEHARSYIQYWATHGTAGHRRLGNGLGRQAAAARQRSNTTSSLTITDTAAHTAGNGGTSSSTTLLIHVVAARRPHGLMAARLDDWTITITTTIIAWQAGRQAGAAAYGIIPYTTPPSTIIIINTTIPHNTGYIHTHTMYEQVMLALILLFITTRLMDGLIHAIPSTSPSRQRRAAKTNGSWTSPARRGAARRARHP